MGIGGTPIAIPEIGKMAGGPGVLYTARCRFGFGTTDYSTGADSTGGGASDGCHVWTDTALAVKLFQLNPVAAGDTGTYMDTTLGERYTYGGIIVYDLFTIVKTAFAGLTAAVIGDCTDSDGWAVDTKIVVGTTGYTHAAGADSDDAPAYGLQSYIALAGLGPKLYLTTDVDANSISIHPTGDATAGIMDVYLVYSLIDEEALATTSWGDTLGS